MIFYNLNSNQAYITSVTIYCPLNFKLDVLEILDVLDVLDVIDELYYHQYPLSSVRIHDVAV